MNILNSSDTGDWVATPLPLSLANPEEVRARPPGLYCYQTERVISHPRVSGLCAADLDFIRAVGSRWQETPLPTFAITRQSEESG